MNYVCDRCWSTQKGLCLHCTPSLEVEIETARSQGEIAGAVETASEEGRQRGQKAVIAKDRQLVCPHCKAETHGARFCPECGKKLAAKRLCTACGAEAGSDAKFCTECGQQVK
ncbi:MAG TPA: zinc ribbon domain-containing protein [Dissulfurispiraceae bacterium]|nr:zinc ribbon domain-containing protein [Dissulfurispiraceae bacterium]